MLDRVDDMVTDLDFEKARYNMVQQQIRPWEVLDERVLNRIATTPRDEYVPEVYRNLAYADVAIPLGHDEVMMTPKVEARMLQALDVKATDTILEVGTGSGYVTALLAGAGLHVDSVEIISEFSARARAKLEAHGVHNAILEVGDAANGWNQGARYDVIAITGSLPALPESFQDSLNVGGRLFAIIGEEPIMEAVLITRVAETEWAHEGLFETSIPPLRNAPSPQRFVF